MAYQLDVESSLINVHSRFISRIFQLSDYKSFNNSQSITNYIKRKKDSNKINDKISLQYSNRDGHISNYNLRLVTFFLKEGIDQVSLQFILNDCLIKLIDIKYGFDTNNPQIQISLLKSVDQLNLWSAFSSQIQHLLSQLQPYDLLQLINTYPAIDNYNIKVNNPQFVFYALNNVSTHLKALQFSQFQSQVNDQLILLQQQFQQLSQKESLLIQKEHDSQQTRPPLSSYPIRPSFTSISNDNDSQLTDLQSSPKSRTFSQTLQSDSQPYVLTSQSTTFSQTLQTDQPDVVTPKQNILVNQFSDNIFNQDNQKSNQASPPSSSKSNQASPPSSPKQPTSNNITTTPQSQFIFSYLQNQLNNYFNSDSNKASKTKITKEVKQFLKQKTIQKNSIYQQYINSHSDNQTHIKLLQKWFDLPSRLSS